MYDVEEYNKVKEYMANREPKIKFSHLYLKLREEGKPYPVKHATLLQVIPVEISTLSKEFINYDTDYGKYKLPFQGQYLMLIFQKHSGDLFTTLRSQFSYNKLSHKTENKYNYYAALVGRQFTVEITPNPATDGKD